MSLTAMADYWPIYAVEVALFAAIVVVLLRRPSGQRAPRSFMGITLLIGAVAVLVAIPSMLTLQSAPAGIFLVKNNTAEPLRCRHRVGPSAWSRHQLLEPGAEFHRRGSDGLLQLTCDPPVKRVVYALRPGERYSLLRAADGAVELRRIAVGE